MNLDKIELGLTYDDVLLIPQKSTISSRSLVQTGTKLSKNIGLAIPFISSNIDTVTESAMAIAMAKLGGFGIIHRFMSIERQVYEVDKVKRSEGFVVGSPFVLNPDHSLKEAKILMKKMGVTSAVIVDKSNKILGLVSDRDTWFTDQNSEVKMHRIMTPISSLITAPINITLEEARRLFKKHKIEKLPLIKKDGTLGGLITSRTVLNVDKFPLATKDSKGRLMVGASVGVVGDYLERAAELIKAGVDAIVVDIAHIHSVHGLKAVKALRKICHNLDLIAGNIATAEAATDLVRLDCDGVKVGIGPGGICITRMVAGAGFPQLSAIANCVKVLSKHKIPLIADGGTNYPADMTKALAAGASSVMLTGWLVGTDESPGAIILRNGKKYKIHRGAASFTAVASRKILEKTDQKAQTGLEDTDLDSSFEHIVPEGIETFIEYKGPVKDVIYQLTGAVKSGMSYSNARTIPELWKNARFVRITSAGFNESRQHNIEEIT